MKQRLTIAHVYQGTLGSLYKTARSKDRGGEE